MSGQHGVGVSEILTNLIHEANMTTESTSQGLVQIEEMRTGARNAVRNCMAITQQDRVFILSDQATHAIGRVLYDASIDAGAQAELHHLEEYAERPIIALPPGIPADLQRFRPTVSFYAASTQPGEVTFRMALRRTLVEEFRTRHGHMPGITYRLMNEGMRTDYRTIAAITNKVYDLVRLAGTIRVTTPDGTDVTANFDPKRRWVPSTGVYTLAGQWGNLPDGETFTCPQDLNGILVVHLLGDYFSQKYGVLDKPLTIDVRDAHVTSVTGSTPETQAIADELLAYLDSAANGQRVGEFAIGTNIGLVGLSGNLLQDEKLPGVHVAFGNSYPDETGADWSSAVHVDVICTHCTISVDNRILMRDGQFDYGLLKL
jgi:aminopeptidase